MGQDDAREEARLSEHQCLELRRANGQGGPKDKAGLSRSTEARERMLTMSDELSARRREYQNAVLRDPHRYSRLRKSASDVSRG